MIQVPVDYFDYQIIYVCQRVIKAILEDMSD